MGLLPSDVYSGCGEMEMEFELALGGLKVDGLGQLRCQTGSFFVRSGLQSIRAKAVDIDRLNE